MSDQRPRQSFLPTRNKVVLLVLVLATACIAEVTLADSIGDPTRPPMLTAVATTTQDVEPGKDRTLVLQAIFFAEGRRVAIINDLRLHERDVIQSAHIIRIERDHVRLRRDTETIELRLVQHDIKDSRPPAAADPNAGDLRKDISRTGKREGKVQ